MDYASPHQTVLQNAKNWRLAASDKRQKSIELLSEADELEARAAAWEAAAAKLEPA